MVRLRGRVSVFVPLKTILPLTVKLPDAEAMASNGCPPVLRIPFDEMFKVSVGRFVATNTLELPNDKVPFCMVSVPFAVKVIDAPADTVTVLLDAQGPPAACLSMVSLLSVRLAEMVCASVEFDPPPRFKVVLILIAAVPATSDPLISPNTVSVFEPKSNVPFVILNMPCTVRLALPETVPLVVMSKFGTEVGNSSPIVAPAEYHNTAPV